MMIRRCPPWQVPLLMLVVVSLTAPCLSRGDDNGLENLRLFYTDAERSAGESQSVAPSSEGPDLELQEVRTPASDKPVASHRHSLPENTEPAEHDLHFSGLLQGDNAILVLLNGVPCKAIAHDRQMPVQSPVPVHCPHLSLPGHKLHYFVNRRELSVIRSGRMIARLKVGQGI